MKHFKNEDLNNLFSVKFNNYSKSCSQPVKYRGAFIAIASCDSFIHQFACRSHWASLTKPRGGAYSFSKIKNVSCHNMRRKKYFFLKNEARDLYRRLSLMLIFMSCSCMSLIYLLLIFRGKVSFFSRIFR